MFTPSEHRVHNMGNARGLEILISWVELYQLGDTIDFRGKEKVGDP
jgi:hypothetical protein